MSRGGKRSGAGRKSRNLEVSKISAYVPDRDVLNQIAKLVKLPTVELLHQIIEHKDFPAMILNIQASSRVKDWYKE